MTFTPRIANAVRNAAVDFLLEDLLADEPATQLLSNRVIGVARSTIDIEVGKLSVYEKLTAMQEIPELESAYVGVDGGEEGVSADEMFADIISSHIYNVLHPFFVRVKSPSFTATDLRALQF